MTKKGNDTRREWWIKKEVRTLKYLVITRTWKIPSPEKVVMSGRELIKLIR